MKAAIYARVSTSDQNCELQLRELREYIARRNWTNAGEYIDSGVSGTKASRPALDRLMLAASRREVDGILVWKIDRFGRSVLHLSQALAQLTTYGVRFLAISQGIDTDAANPSSRLMLTILAGVAEFEREIIRERTLAGVRAAQARGAAIGRPRRVFRRDQVVQMRDGERMSWRAIAARLGVPVSTVRDAYRECAETVASESSAASAKQRDIDAAA
jgi:putative DNA-invertase from lambdoid prophage Rac